MENFNLEEEGRLYMEEISNRFKIEIEDYHFKTFWSDEDNCFFGICIEFPSLSAFGDSEEEALAEIKFVICECIKIAEESGVDYPKPSLH